MSSTVEPDIIEEGEMVAPGKDIPEKKPRKKREPKLEGFDEKKGKKEKDTPKKKVKKRKIPEFTEEAIAKQILGIHMILALRFQSAKIEMEDALLIAAPVKEIIDEYEMEWLTKYMPFISLIGATAIVEFPVVVGIREEIREHRAREKKAVQINGNVLQIQGGPIDEH